MRKHSINVEAGTDISWAAETNTDPAFAEAVVVQTAEYHRVFVSGLTARTANLDITDQTRDILEQIKSTIVAAGGGMGDIVRVRVYVAEPHLDQGTFRGIHKARSEFFDASEYPASTLVEVSDLIRPGRFVEIDAEAVIPIDGWEAESVE